MQNITFYRIICLKNKCAVKGDVGVKPPEQKNK